MKTWVYQPRYVVEVALEEEDFMKRMVTRKWDPITGQLYSEASRFLFHLLTLQRKKRNS